jgi:hypothetical protein
VAIYHRVYSHETFEDAATTIFELIRDAQDRMPKQPRALYLDIEGHRNPDGRFDHDMYELQTEFLPKFVGAYLTQLSCPLVHARRNDRQHNDVPQTMAIQPVGS